jgi:hypothetical protein
LEDISLLSIVKRSIQKITYCNQARRQKDRAQHSDKSHFFAIPLHRPGNSRLDSQIPLLDKAVKLFS